HLGLQRWNSSAVELCQLVAANIAHADVLSIDVRQTGGQVHHASRLLAEREPDQVPGQSQGLQLKSALENFWVIAFWQPERGHHPYLGLAIRLAKDEG